MKKLALAVLSSAVFVSSAMAEKPKVYEMVKGISKLCQIVSPSDKVLYENCKKDVDELFGKGAYENSGNIIRNILRTCYLAYKSEKYFGYDSPVTQENILDCEDEIDRYFDYIQIKYRKEKWYQSTG